MIGKYLYAGRRMADIEKFSKDSSDKANLHGILEVPCEMQVNKSSSQ
jgi:hypothetical protein